MQNSDIVDPSQKWFCWIRVSISLLGLMWYKSIDTFPYMKHIFTPIYSSHALQKYAFKHAFPVVYSECMQVRIYQVILAGSMINFLIYSCFEFYLYKCDYKRYFCSYHVNTLKYKYGSISFHICLVTIHRSLCAWMNIAHITYPVRVNANFLPLLDVYLRKVYQFAASDETWLDLKQSE